MITKSKEYLTDIDGRPITVHTVKIRVESEELAYDIAKIAEEMIKGANNA